MHVCSPFHPSWRRFRLSRRSHRRKCGLLVGKSSKIFRSVERSLDKHREWNANPMRSRRVPLMFTPTFLISIISAESCRFDSINFTARRISGETRKNDGPMVLHRRPSIDAIPILQQIYRHGDVPDCCRPCPTTFRKCPAECRVCALTLMDHRTKGPHLSVRNNSPSNERWPTRYANFSR